MLASEIIANFDVSLTMYLSITSDNDQPDAQIFIYLPFFL
jgi:hypothetical protein